MLRLGGQGIDRRRHVLAFARHDRIARQELDVELHVQTSLDDAVERGHRYVACSALDLAYVAAGRFDIYWERNLSPWDIAPGILLVREAGGYVSDCDGQDAMLIKGHIAAGNETLHKELLKLLKEAGKL